MSMNRITKSIPYSGRFQGFWTFAFGSDLPDTGGASSNDGHCWHRGNKPLLHEGDHDETYITMLVILILMLHNDIFQRSLWIGREFWYDAPQYNCDDSFEGAGILIICHAMISLKGTGILIICHDNMPCNDMPSRGQECSLWVGWWWPLLSNTQICTEGLYIMTTMIIIAITDEHSNLHWGTLNIL